LACHLTIGTPSLASFLIAASSHLSAGGSGVVLVVLEVVVGVRVEQVVLAPAGNTTTESVMPKETCTVQMYGNVPGTIAGRTRTASS